ncbi:MAG: hypothetical protein AAGB29_01850 [Planctomycetota bacterium]
MSCNLRGQFSPSHERHDRPDELDRRDTLPNLTQLGLDEGWQACRTSGQGRMMEPEAIIEAVQSALTS